MYSVMYFYTMLYLNASRVLVFIHLIKYSVINVLGVTWIFPTINFALTRPSSTRLVTMTMRCEFFCHANRQMSLSVNLLGPCMAIHALGFVYDWNNKTYSAYKQRDRWTQLKGHIHYKYMLCNETAINVFIVGSWFK